MDKHGGEPVRSVQDRVVNVARKENSVSYSQFTGQLRVVRHIASSNQHQSNAETSIQQPKSMQEKRYPFPILQPPDIHHDPLVASQPPALFEALNHFGGRLESAARRA